MPRAVPKLTSQLYEESIFISIGHREFQIPRDILTDPANSPNYFSLGFGFFLARPSDNLFPGLDREGLIRPPSILAPSVPNRSADVFADLLRLLRGYPVHVRDESHRQDLLRDARYFHFKGLEQRLIPHSITNNQIRGRQEITLRLENVQKSGISVSYQGAPHDPSTGWVKYARPLVDERPAELVLEIGGEACQVDFNAPAGPRAEFFNDTKARVAKLLEVVATKFETSPTTGVASSSSLSSFARNHAGDAQTTPALGSTPASPSDTVRVSFESTSAIILDGEELGLDASSASSSEVSGPGPSRKRRRGADGAVVAAAAAAGSAGHHERWTVGTGQWRLRVQPAPAGSSGVECVLVAVKIDAMSSELSRNTARSFLS